MKKLIFISFFLIIGLKGFGQNLTIDTINVYWFLGEYTTLGSDTIFQSNGQIYNSIDYHRLKKSMSPLIDSEDLDRLYYVNLFNTGDTLLYSTYWLDIEQNQFGNFTSYHPNGKVSVQGQFLFFKKLKKFLIYENQHCKTGKWLFYSDTGKLKKTKYYKKNKLVTTIKN